MQLRRNEIMTGLLVMATVAVLVFVLILLGAPGLFRPLITYHIYIDNASAIKLGAPVMLAGRKIGQVEKLYSPVSKDESKRAEDVDLAIHPPEPGASPTPSPSPNRIKYEARIDVQVEKTALVYRDSRARLISLGLLGEYAIDFTQGNDSAGRAVNGQVFAGERAADFSEIAAKVVEILQPVAKEATNALKELQTTTQNLGRITDDDSQLNMAIAQFRTFAENITSLTARNSSLNQSLDNIKSISAQMSDNDNLKITLQNFRDSSDRLKSTLNSLSPDLKTAGANIAQLTDTVKTEPWRLLWPSKKKYPEGESAGAVSRSGDTITVRKSTKASGSPSPTPAGRRAVIVP